MYISFNSNLGLPQMNDEPKLKFKLGKSGQEWNSNDYIKFLHTEHRAV